MARHTRIPPSRQPGPPGEPRGILELDRFSEASLRQWQTLSQDLDELERALYYALEPERRRLYPELIAALQGHDGPPFEMEQWVRLVSYTHSLNPLSAAGSLLRYGARFNPGADLEEGTLLPWPALYLAQDHQTAFREKFQLASHAMVDGLSPAELALQPGMSHVAVVVRGRLARVFDATSQVHFDLLARVLARIKMPQRARQLMKKLGIPSQVIYMVRTGKQLHDMVLMHNWRRLPVQFDLPAPSQVLAGLVRAAGFEAILYSSTKGSGKCLAVFLDQLHETSFIELVDKPPHASTARRLDAASADALAGWDVLPSQKRGLR